MVSRNNGLKRYNITVIHRIVQFWSRKDHRFHKVCLTAESCKNDYCYLWDELWFFKLISMSARYGFCSSISQILCILSKFVRVNQLMSVRYSKVSKLDNSVKVICLGSKSQIVIMIIYLMMLLNVAILLYNLALFWYAFFNLFIIY